MVIADTNIWCDFFRHGDRTLASLIENDFLAIHPLIIGELSVGMLPNRKQTIKDLQNLPTIRTISDTEALTMIEERQLFGQGVQWNDILILGAVLTTPGALLWTRDRRLAAIATDYQISYHQNALG